MLSLLLLALAGPSDFQSGGLSALTARCAFESRYRAAVRANAACVSISHGPVSLSSTDDHDGRRLLRIEPFEPRLHNGRTYQLKRGLEPELLNRCVGSVRSALFRARRHLQNGDAAEPAIGGRVTTSPFPDRRAIGRTGRYRPRSPPPEPFLCSQASGWCSYPQASPLPAHSP